MDAGAINVDRLLGTLLQCSERSAQIARIFRAEESMFQLLVEEKSDKEKNKRFVQDFKTLADVLVQVTIKKKLGQEFPAISSKIQGEEQNSFQNAVGESIKVELSDSRRETVDLLCRVLDGNASFAERIAFAVHSTEGDSVQVSKHPDFTFPAERIGIWIDPIDSTLEYIQGKCEETTEQDIIQFGLTSVCVLVGAYDLITGDPILGVVTQPFYFRDIENRWSSKSYWGLSCGDRMQTSILPHSTQTRRKIVVTSTSECDSLQTILRQHYDVIHASGAGYKSLLVARGDVDMYVLSRGSTYFWDTCAPHALLAAAGGGILDFGAAISVPWCPSIALQSFQVKYTCDGDTPKPFQNSGGILAYREPEDALEFLGYLHSKGFQMLS